MTPADWLFSTDRIGWRTWTEADLPLARALWGSREVMALLHVDGRLDEDGVRARLAEEIELQRAHGYQYWPIFDRASGAHLGCCGLRPKRPELERLETGFHLLPSAWGRGLATEAAQLVIRHAFEVVGARSLFAGHHPENVGSRRVLEKLGFRYDHHELYPATQLQHPTYLLFPPGEPGSV